jgi:hypothetical protein
MYHRFADPRSRSGDYRHFVLKPLHLVFSSAVQALQPQTNFFIPPFSKGEVSEKLFNELQCHDTIQRNFGTGH